MFKNKKNDPKYLSPKPTGITVWFTGSIGTISTGKKNLYREEESTEYERRILAVNTPANSSSPHVDGSGCSREGVVVGLKDPHACLRHRTLDSPRTRNGKPRLKKKKSPGRPQKKRGTRRAQPGVNEYLLFRHRHVRGERERSPPLPQIMQSSFPHLGKSQGSAHPECNG